MRHVLVCVALALLLSGASADRWVKLLEDAQYGGTFDNVYTPLRTSVAVSAIKAVWRSGEVACNTGTLGSGYAWQTCHDGSTPAFSFELQRNDDYILSQPDWRTLPSGCEVPSPARVTDGSIGDIVCQVDFEIKTGDTLTPTWYEASRQSSISDNGGTIHIDLYGKVSYGETGLLLWWKFDEGEGTTLADSSGSPELAGEIRGEATWNQGLLGFSKQGDTVVSPALPVGGVSGDAPFSMSVWVYWDGGSEWPATFSDEQAAIALTGGGTSSAGSGHVALTFNSGRPAVEFFNGRVRATEPIKARRWVHIAVTKSPGTKSETTFIYVNGLRVAAAAENNAGIGGYNNPPSLSARNIVASPGYLYASRGWDTHWEGYLADIRVAPSTWPSEVVSAIYEATLPRHNRNYVAKLDGATEHIELPAVEMGGERVTMEAWVYSRDPTSSGQAIVDLAVASETDTIALYLQQGTGFPTFRVDARPAGGADALSVLSSLDQFPRYRWTHVAAVQDESDATLYIDGEVVASSESFVSVDKKHRRKSFVGRSSLPSTSMFFGQLDDIRLWTVARSPEQINDAIVSGLPQPSSVAAASALGLVLWLDFAPTTSSPFVNAAESVGLATADAALQFPAGAKLQCEHGCVVPGRRDGAVCGDGFVQDDELCDDGNTDSGDGCTSECDTESGFVCFTDTPMVASTCQPGRLVMRETFDDGSEAINRWSFGLGEHGERGVADDYARRGAGGLRLYNKELGSTSSATQTWTYVERTVGSMSTSTLVRYQFNIRKNAHGQASPLVVIFLDSTETRKPPDCSDSTCIGVTFYKLCYNSGFTPHCDERLEVEENVWIEHAFNPSDKFARKYGEDATAPAGIKVQFAVFGDDVEVESWIDNVVVADVTDVADCPPLEATSPPFIGASCYDHYQHGARISGVYPINRGSGQFDLYCEMEIAGGGWDLVTVSRSERLDFGTSRCTSLSSTCFGNINKAATVFDTELGGLSGSEVLAVHINTGRWGWLSGWSSDVSSSGYGFVAQYMTRSRLMHTSTDCGYNSVPYQHYCGKRYETALKWEGNSGWNRHSTGPNLYTWIRGKGIWIGDANGGGSGSDHQLDMSYHNARRSCFQQSPYLCDNDYALYWRNPNMVGGVYDQITLTRGGNDIIAANEGTGLNLVVVDEESASGAVTGNHFEIGDSLQENSLITFLSNVAEGHVVMGAQKGTWQTPQNGAALQTAFATIGVDFPLDMTGKDWSFIGRKGFPTPGLMISRITISPEYLVRTYNYFTCYGQQVTVPENTPAGLVAVVPVRTRGIARASNFEIVFNDKIDQNSVVNNFYTDMATGQIRVLGQLDAESDSGAVTLGVLSQAELFDSGWFPMSSQQGINSFKELSHNIDIDPAYLRVSVRVRAVDGDNDGYVFIGSGAAQQSDSTSSSVYGGVVFAYNPTSVRIWAPSVNNGASNGRMINIGSGWGGEMYYQYSQDGEVRVEIEEEPTPDYDSGWFLMTANIDQASGKEVTHGLGSRPARVKVMTQAIDGNNDGYIFEGIGSAQSDDDHGEFGGLVFAYDDSRVRLFAPDKSNNREGYIINVGDGWAGDHLYQRAQKALVRVFAWNEQEEPDWESGEFEMISDRAQAFAEKVHGLGVEPARVQVQIRATGGSCSGFTYEGMGMCQEAGYYYWTSYGGVIFGYNDQTVRLWAPTRDPRNADKHSLGRVIFHADGWAGGWNGMSQTTGMVNIRVWGRKTNLITDAASVTMSINDVEEPPLLHDGSLSVLETATVGTVLGTLEAEDEDAGDHANLEYTILSGDPLGAFRLGTGANANRLEVATAGILDYARNPRFALVVRASDGLLSDVATVFVNVIDVNNRPVIEDAEFFVVEESPVNTLVGTPPNATDKDVEDTLLFSIIAGNVMYDLDGEPIVDQVSGEPVEVFKIATCGGQLRVANDILDYETQTSFVLVIDVTDDAEEPLNATATITVNVVNKNDPPECEATSVDLDENVDAATVVTSLSADDPDGDDLSWEVDFGNSGRQFVLAEDGELTTSETAVINYEATTQYSLGVTVTDNGVPSLSCSMVLTIDVQDLNDAPTVPADQTLAISENNVDSAVVGTVRAEDEDVLDTLVFSQLGSSPAIDTFDLAGDGTLSVKPGISLDFEAVESWELQLSVTDSGSVGPAKSTTSTQIIEVLDANDAPVFTSDLSAFSVPENSVAGTVVAPGPLQASDQDEDSSDPDDPQASGLRYYLTNSDAFEVDAVTGEVKVTGAVHLDFESETTYTADVSVVDDGAIPASDEGILTITVTDVNDAPTRLSTILANPLLETPRVPVNDTFFFGDHGDDVDACADDCLQEPSCAAFTLYKTTYYQTEFAGQCYGRTNATGGLTTRGTGTVIWSGVRVPVCRRFTAVENAAATLTGSGEELTATDQDGDAVTISIGAGNPTNNPFYVTATPGSNSGVLGVTAGLLDFEASPVVKLTIVGTDDGTPEAAGDALAVIDVTNVDEPPIINAPVPPESDPFVIAEGAAAGTPIGAPINAQDPEGETAYHSMINPSFVEGGTSATLEVIKQILSIDETNGQLAVNDAEMFADYTEGAVFKLTIEACDVQGTDDAARCSDARFDINLVDGNFAPEVNAGQVLSVNENSAVGVACTPGIVAEDPQGDSLFYALQAGVNPEDVSYFSIDNSGVVTVAKEGLNYEEQNTFSMLVVVTDDDVVEPRSTSREFTVVLNDVNEDPICPDLALAINENEPIGTTLGGQIKCTDEDEVDGEPQEIEFSIVSGDDFPATFDPADAGRQSYILTVAQDALDFERKEFYTMVLTADDNAGGVTSSWVNVTVRNVFEAPVLQDPSPNGVSFEPDENVAVGTVLGTFPATDPDGDVLSWDFAEVDGDDNSDDASRLLDGKIVMNGPNMVVAERLDFEARRAYTFTVMVYDNADRNRARSDSVEVTVNVQDVNDVTVLSVLPVDMETAGSETMTVEGTDFGRLDVAPTSVLVTYGPADNITKFTATDCVVSESNTQITCQTAEGVGSELYVAVTVDGQLGDSLTPNVPGTPQVRVSYKPPTISSVRFDFASATEGGEPLIITGTNFGPDEVWNRVGAVYGETMLYDASATCSIDPDSPHTRIFCETVAGAGASHRLQVTIGDQVSDWSVDRISYALPVVEAMWGAALDMSTRGDEIVYISGTNFGPGDADPLGFHTLSAVYGDFTENGATVTFTATCRVVTPHEVAECTTSPGVGANLAWKLLLGGQTGPASVPRSSYRTPAITRISGEGAEDASTRGGERIVLDGTDFGPIFPVSASFSPLKTPSATYGKYGEGFNAQGCTVSIAHERVVCSTAVGTGFGYGWVLTIGLQQSDVFYQQFRNANGTSYAPPLVSAFDVVGDVPPDEHSFNTEGSETVVIYGSQFGVVDSAIESARYFQEDSDDVFHVDPSTCTIEVEHTEIHCKTVPGAGRGLEWKLVISGQESTNPVTAYAPPVVEEVTYDFDFASSDGGETVILIGSNFGPADGQGPFVDSVTYGVSGIEYEVSDFRVEYDETNVTTRIVLLTEPGQGTDLVFIVKVAGQASEPSADTISYAAPVITSVSPSSARTDEGGKTIKVTGTNFAALDPSAILEIRFGNEEDGSQLPLIQPRSQKPDPTSSSFNPATYVRGSPHVLEFSLPEGLGARRGVAVSIRSGGTRVWSAPVAFNYRAPDLVYVEVTAATFGGGDEIRFLEEMEFAEDVRRLKLAGSSFGPPGHVRGVDVSPDGITREVLMQPRTRNMEPLGDFSAANLTIYSWNHTEIIAFGSVYAGAVRVRNEGVGFDGAPVAQESREAVFVDLSPEIFSQLGTSAFPTNPPASPDINERILTLEVRNMLSATNVTVTVNGQLCQLVDLDNNPITNVDDIRPALIDPVVDELYENGLTPDASTVWQIPCQMVPGEGSYLLNTGAVYRDSVRSASFPLAYRSPTIESIATRSSPGAAWDTTTNEQPAQPFDTLVVPTHGAWMRIRGKDFGLCPVVSVIGATDKVYFCGEQATPGVTRTHTFLEFPVPEGKGSGPIDGVKWGIGLDVADQAAVGLFPLSYEGPSVAWVELLGSSDDASVLQLVATGDDSPNVPLNATGLKTQGGQIIRLHGNNFGPPTPSDPDRNPMVWVGSEDGPHPLGWRSCEVLNFTHMYVDCVTPPATGADLYVRVLVDRQWSQLTGGIGYSRPTITGIAHVDTPVEEALAPGSEPLRGSTVGGYNVTIYGENFGRRNASHCVFVSWRHAVTAQRKVPVCDGIDASDLAVGAWTGEGEIPFSDIYFHNDTQITFRWPEGMGDRVVSVSVREQVAEEQSSFLYNSPVLHAMDPVTAGTDGGTPITLYGEDLGSLEFVEMAWINVNFSSTMCNYTSPTCTITEHTHDHITMTTPGGVGTDRPVEVVTFDGEKPLTRYDELPEPLYKSEPLIFNYLPPEVTFIIPNRIDAEGEAIEVNGVNFGRSEDMHNWAAHERIVNVTINDDPCLNPERQTRRGRAILRCDAQRLKVGFKNVTILVAGQYGHVYEEEGAFEAQCTKNFYGQTGEWCLPCPDGAYCDGFKDGVATEPMALEGFWNINSSNAEGRCVEHREHRAYCNHLVGCEPKDACLGDNICKPGYASAEPWFRCATCDKCYQEKPTDPCQMFYKQHGECVECPDNAIVLVIGFIVAVVFLAAVGYVLNKKNMHLAFLSIGVDYFQVLAMFASSRVEWPPLLKDIFNLLSLFNFDLGITAPECAIPDFGFERKWFSIEILPISLAGLFLIIHVYLYLYKWLCLRRDRKKRNTHVDTLVATVLIMMYYLYLVLTRTILDVFNCGPTDPPDPEGRVFLQAEFVPCGEPGGVQVRLLPYAVVALIAYSIGFPAFVAHVLYKNFPKIMEDQLLRARKTGDDRMTNRNAYSVRKRFHKLYYHFRPDTAYWILAIITRKFMIAFTALMFNRNPGFQLSIALLVMFVSYAAQVRYVPYMSPSEMTEVLYDHERKADEGDLRHMRLREALATSATRGRKKATGTSLLAAAKKREEENASVASFFWNYNTVEAVLLGCAVLVTLSGVMFESNRFQSEYYQAQRDAITYFVLFIIFASIVYFFIVLGSEIAVTCAPKKFTKKGKDGKPITKKKASMMPGQGVEMSAASMASASAASMNPMFVAAAQAGALESGGDVDQMLSSSKAPNAQQWPALQAGLRRMQEQVQFLSEENKRLKKKAATGSSRRLSFFGRSAPSGDPAKKGRTRKQFGQTSAPGSSSRVVETTNPTRVVRRGQRRPSGGQRRPSGGGAGGQRRPSGDGGAGSPVSAAVSGAVGAARSVARRLSRSGSREQI